MSHSSGIETGRDFPPVFLCDWDGMGSFFLREWDGFENPLPCRPLLPTPATAATSRIGVTSTPPWTDVAAMAGV